MAGFLTLFLILETSNLHQNVTIIVHNQVNLMHGLLDKRRVAIYMKTKLINSLYYWQSYKSAWLMALTYSLIIQWESSLLTLK